MKKKIRIFFNLGMALQSQVLHESIQFLPALDKQTDIDFFYNSSKDKDKDKDKDLTFLEKMIS